MVMIQYCLGKVLVSKITDICYFPGREVRLPTVVCHDVVSLDVCYFHGREVGLPTVVCHDVVSLDVCYFHGREVGLPTVVCHDVVSLDVCYFHGREIGLPTVVCHDAVSLVIFRYLWFWYFHGYFYDMMGTYIYVLLHVVKQIQVLRFLKIMSVRFLSINFILLDLGNDGFCEMFLNGEPYKE